jgi:hypothetical protein
MLKHTVQNNTREGVVLPCAYSCVDKSVTTYFRFATFRFAVFLAAFLATFLTARFAVFLAAFFFAGMF